MLRYTLFLLALFLATGAGVAAQEPAYTLVITDHQFQPTEIEIPSGQKIALTVKNNDSTPEEFESTELRREKVVAGGVAVRSEERRLEPG
jgi:hypothetical protein